MQNKKAMKRRIQWLNLLEYNVKHRAIANMQAQLFTMDYMEEFCSFELMIKSSFSLKDSREGQEFWDSIILSFNIFNL